MKVVQCHGCFDLLHLGHIRHLEAAKQQGEWLVVTVTPDRYVNKGHGRPAFTAAQRAEALMALREVDEVQITESPTAADAIRQIRPAVFAKGPDYADNLHPDEAQAIADVGAKLVITETQKWSSTALLREPHPYLDGLRAKYSAADVFGYLDKALSLRVLVIGDAIRDEYVYCDTLGKSGKDPILAARFVREEAFQGGVDAVAHHVGAVADAVDVLTGPITVKRRFIENYPFQKLPLEIYHMDERAANDETPRLLETLPGLLREADLVIVADYGHGLLTPPVIELLTDKARRLAVNTQANAGNHGFNTISKYRRANLISLSERELRLDARDQQSQVVDLMAKRIGTTLVTRGEKGCIGHTFPGEFSAAPALTTHTVDRTGAGDAVFAVTACCAAVGMPLDLLTFMASVVGTQAVGIVGNARYIERKSLRAAVESYL